MSRSPVTYLCPEDIMGYVCIFGSLMFCLSFGTKILDRFILGGFVMAFDLYMKKLLCNLFLHKFLSSLKVN